MTGERPKESEVAMNNRCERTNQSLLIRLLDAFLNENNIKWILGAGILILLGSSTMLAASHWESYTPAWQYGIMLAYTAAIYGLGWGAYRLLGLRTTGNALMALTVLLLPVLFFALRFVQASAFWLTATNGVFLGGTALFTAFAAGHIFEHFMKGKVPLFRFGYVTLAVSGALASRVPASWAPAAAGVLWLVYCAGLVKVNRHVFWLGEDRRTPRIFGFFPMMLLSAQFLAVFLLYLAPHLSLSWTGFGLVLLGLPVFLTADAVWRVHRQRTGLLPEPRMAVIVPVLVGLGLTLGAVVLSGVGFFSGQSPYAMVPTAVVAAILMGLVAVRTGRPSFVWLMLVFGLIAYNFSPVFFQEAARSLVENGARSVDEERLPYAFYGLTYLPLLGLLAAAGHRLLRKKEQLFGPPVRIATIALSCLWLGMAATHLKAMTPVGLAMTAVFLTTACLYRRPWLLIMGISAWFLAALGGVYFANTVFLGVPDAFLPPMGLDGPLLLVLALASLALLIPGRLLDGLLSRRTGQAVRIMEQGSSISVVALAGLWTLVSLFLFLVGMADPPDPHWLSLSRTLGAAVTLALLVRHGHRLDQPAVRVIGVLFAYGAVLLTWLPAGPSVATVTAGLTLALFGQWLASHRISRLQVPRIVAGFRPALEEIAYIGGTLTAFAMIACPLLFPGEFEPFWPARLIAVGFTADAARRRGSHFHGYIGALYLFGLIAAATLAVLGPEAGWAWLPAVIAAAAAALVPLARRLFDESEDSAGWTGTALAVPLRHVLAALLLLGAFGTLGGFSWPCRLAGAVSLAGLWRLTDSPRDRFTLAAVANWHLLLALMSAVNPGFPVLTGPFPIALLAAAAGLSAAMWRGLLPKIRSVGTPAREPEVIRFHRGLLRITAGAALVITSFNNLSAVGIALSMAGFVFLVLDQVWAACRRRSPRRVWIAEAVAALSVAFLALQGVIHFGRGVSMFAVLGVGAAAALISRGARGHRSLSIVSEPLRLTALSMPALTVLIAVGRELAGRETTWPGMSSLALFLAATAYFVHGLRRRARWALIGSQAILNLALFLLWGELSFTDPQLFLIPVGISILLVTHLLRSEIPEKYRHPLHYAGALVILVSPTFNLLGGEWVHFFSLMLISVLVMVAAIALRLRALLYTGAAFLTADVVAMVVRSSIDRPNTLWVAGLILGAGVVALGAVSEIHRDRLLQRIRAFGAVLETWN